jgi:calcineurin-like phosphoesterase family protein
LPTLPVQFVRGGETAADVRETRKYRKWEDLMLFFTSDWHIGHRNIIEHCQRPFKDVQEMHRTLIDNYNSVVADKDEVWFLGDIGFRDADTINSVLSQLTGRKHIVWGNHDKANRKVLAPHFESAQDYKELKYEKRFLVLMHYPLQSWNKSKHGSIHLHGHCHGSLPSHFVRRQDVGVDIYNFFPVSLNEILNSFQC